MHRWFLAVWFTWVANAAFASLGPAGGELEQRAPSAPSRPFAMIFALNDPVPAVMGASIGYDIFDFLRVQAGVGTFSSDYDFGFGPMTLSSMTWGFGLRVRLPKRALSPIVGIHWARIETDLFPDPMDHYYVIGGLEWRSSFGMSLAAGYEQSFESRVGGLPFAQLGWNLSLL